MRVFSRYLVGIALLAAVYWGLRYAGLGTSLAQLICIPALFLVLRFSLSSVLRIPWLIGIVAVVCAVAGVVFATQVRLDRSSPFYVARLSDDEHEAYGRIFREKINEWLEVLEVETRVAREPAIVETPEHARASLRSTAGHALVWGDRRWVNVLLSEPTEVLLASLDDLLFPEYGAFKIVSSVPAIGMSLESVDGTARFLGTAFATMKMSDDGAVSDAEIELFWRQAANTAGLWTVSYTHLTLPTMIGV